MRFIIDNPLSDKLECVLSLHNFTCHKGLGLFMNFTYLIEGTLFGLIVLLIGLAGGFFFTMATVKPAEGKSIVESRIEFGFYGVASLVFAGLLTDIIS